MDISKVISSLCHHDVYRIRLGRTFQDEDEAIQDAESIGVHQLVDGKSSALKEYNTSFKSTQKAHRRPIVSKMAAHTSLPKHPPEARVVTESIQARIGDSQDVSDLGASQVDQDTDESEEEGLGVVEFDADSEMQEPIDDTELLEEELGTMFNDEVDSLFGGSDGESSESSWRWRYLRRLDSADSA